MSDDRPLTRPDALRAGRGQYFFDVDRIAPIKAMNSDAHGVYVEGERMIVALMRMPAARGSKPHSHTSEQWSYILDGAMESIRDGQRLTVGAGWLIYNPARMLHHAQAGPGADVRFFTVKDVSWSPPAAGAGAAAAEPAALRPGPGSYFFDLGAAKPNFEDADMPGATGPSLEGERLGIALVRLPPGSSTKPRRRSFEQWFYLTQGGADWVVEGQRRRCGPGSLVYVPAGSVHAAAAIADAGAVFVIARDLAHRR